jgi:dihydrolipoamide dehydrogenase
VEKTALGGVCLHRGCVPTKTLLHSAKLYRHAKEGEQFGVRAKEVAYDYEAAVQWRDKVVQTMHGGVQSQMKRHKVTVIEEEGRLAARTLVETGSGRYAGDAVFIATGSSPARPPIPGIDLPHVVTSDEALALEKLPKKLAVIGGGVIGMEFASYFSAVGVEVHVIEMLEEICPVLDTEVAAGLRKAVSDVTYHLGAKVTSIDEGGVTFELPGAPGSAGGVSGAGAPQTDGANGAGAGAPQTDGAFAGAAAEAGGVQRVEADTVLVAVGRTANIGALNVEELGLDADRRGIRVDEQMRTNLPGLYAVGDVTGMSMLAHSAYRMADTAVKAIAGVPSRMRYQAIPWVVYTLPEAAGCGHTVASAERAGLEPESATMPLRASGRFFAEHGRAPGFCKVVVDRRSRTLIGVHMLGEGCSEHIFGAATIIESELRVEEIREIVFPHPTVSEIIQDTVWELPL